MASLGPDIHRFYRDISTRLNGGIGNINTSLRELAHSCADRFYRLQDCRTQSVGMINNDAEDNNALANATGSPTNLPTPATCSVSVDISTNANAAECTQNLNSSSGQSSQLRSSRNRNTRRNVAHHSYPHGLISIRTLEKDRNVLAAILSIVVIAVLATALAQFKWFSIYNDMCDVPHFYGKREMVKDLSKNGDKASILEIQPLSSGHKSYIYSRPYHSAHSTVPPPIAIYRFPPGYSSSCSTPQILALKRTIIGLCFLAIMCSLIQFFMDIMGTKRKWVNSMRTHAVGNISTVLLCVLIIGLCYFVSILYERVQLHQLFRKLRQLPPGMLIKHYMKSEASVDQSKAIDIFAVHQVKFELSYYLVTLSGFLSILAAAANLFRRPRPIMIERISHTRSSARPHGDESLLLNSEVLNNDSSPSYLSLYHPIHDLIFNSNWSSFYNSDSNYGPTTNRPTTSVMQPPAPMSNCPPPPPYSP